jgi:DNA-binding transcriptional MerR regulator
MQVSELVRRSGVPLATVKFYIREGMLAPGQPTSPRRATYDESHLQRLRLIRSLGTAAGLPLSRIRKVLDVLDAPEGSVQDMLSRAMAALSVETENETATDELPEGAFPRARAATVHLGDGYRPRLPAIALLENALAAVEEAGIPATPERLRVYGPHVRAMAQAEISEVESRDPVAAVEFAVLGTTLYEPVLNAIRRLAHQNISADSRRPA